MGCSGDRSQPGLCIHPEVWLRLTHGWVNIGSCPRAGPWALAAHQGPSRKTNIRARSSQVAVEMEELTRVVRLSQPG